MFACLLFWFLSQAVSAAGTGTIAVYLREANVQFSLYRVANANNTLTGDFAGCGVRIPPADNSAAAWQSAAQTLEKYVDEHSLSCLAQGDTSAGVARFEGLEDGLYLVLGASSVIDGRSQRPIPVFVKVSGKARAVYAKYEQEKADDPADPAPPGDGTNGSDDPTTPSKPGKPSGPKLPQTGQLNWPIPLMATLGLCLFSAGWTICRRHGKEGYAK